LVCAIVDARTGFIFDALSLSMILIAGAIGIHAGRVVDGALAVAVIGGLLGSLYLLTGRRGIGLGDVKLGSAIALGSGLGAGTVAIGSAFVLGAAYALILIALGRARRTDTLRFGPFLAGGAAVGVTFGIVGWPW
jgi:leader peptidase (prepilin peptidase)/N-methyltransferase